MEGLVEPSYVPYTKTNHMATIPSLSSELDALSVQLRTEVSSILLSADTSGLTTVMGAGCVTAGRVTPAELSNMIKSDDAIQKALAGIEDKVQAEIRRAIRALVEGYAEQVADGTYAATRTEMEARVVIPVINRARGAQKVLMTMDSKIQDLKASAARIQSAGANSEASDKSAQTYRDNIKFVSETALKLHSYDVIIKGLTAEIDTIMFCRDSGATERAANKQTSRNAMTSERKYVEKSLLEYFDSGSNQQSGAVKVHLKELKIPEQLEKDKGVELIMAAKAFLKNRAPSYYAIIPDLLRIMEEAKIGNYYKPSSKRDGYSGLPMAIREIYEAQAQELYDELALKVPARIMNNIRVSFKYGQEDKQAQCEPGDGPTALFCLLALYRPAGLAYRDSIRETLESASNKFKDGTNPLAKIKEIRATILEALDLNVRVSRRTTGKGIVTVMLERGNTFAQKLAKYTELGAVVDQEDCIVELNRLFTDIEDNIIQLQEAGVDVKKVMQINVMSTDKAKGTDKECWYGKDCTRNECVFSHPGKKSGKGDGKGKGKGDSKGKGKGAGKGKGKGEGKGKGAKSSTCKAKGCQAPSRGWPLCDNCRREGLEKGKITMKDGTVEAVVVKKRKLDDAMEKRLAQLEKSVMAASQAGQDGDDTDDDDVYVGGGAPKCAQKNSKAANAASGVKERLGKRVKSSDDQINWEFQQE